ncbi:Rhodanese-like protein, partial [Leucogyrophana mollusca]
QHKLERMASGSLLSAFAKPTLQGLGAPSSNVNKRPRRPAFSALVQPSEAPVLSAYPALDSAASPEEKPQTKLPPTRRAYSAMLPATALEHLSDESSFNGPDMSSPAQAYAKRQQVKTIRRRDGTDDFRPLTGALAMVQRDVQESPSAKFMNAGLPGFGDNETLGKILPCHRVREDGLMRINPQTLDALLDGAYDTQIANYHVVDCRFDYEYNGGHVPGAININTTAGVEEFLLGLDKPKPCVSGDSAKKTVLVFHCEFSAKRAPTFAKHLRAKDRAMNNHVYPKIHYPEVYILEGGYCEYYRQCAPRCQPQGYVTMDDPNHALSRKEDLDQFRKAKFGRTKSYAYGEGAMKMSLSQQPKRNTAPTGATQLFAAANAARTRRNGLSTLAEIGNTTIPTDDEDTDIGDSPCPPPTKGLLSKAKKLGRAPISRAETYDAARMAY